MIMLYVYRVRYPNSLGGVTALLQIHSGDPISFVRYPSNCAVFLDSWKARKFVYNKNSFFFFKFFGEKMETGCD